MLKLTVGTDEGWNDEKQEFVELGGTTLQFEHSLVSLSKWESTWEKAFLGAEAKTAEETIGYIEAMCLTPDVNPDVFKTLTDKDVQRINEYINKKMTATWFNDRPGPAARNHEVITSELIYYWLIALNIPWEAQHWHLERLLTLIKVCNQKNQPPKKMPKQEWAARQRQLNAERKAKLNTNG